MIRWILRVIASTACLDVVALSPQDSEQAFQRAIERVAKNRKTYQWTFLPRTSQIVWFLIRATGGMFQVSKIPTLPRDAIVFIAGSHNQRQALSPIAIKVSESKVTIQGDDFENLRRLGAFAALPFLPSLILAMLKARGCGRRSFKQKLANYWIIYGIYFVARIFFKTSAARCVVVSNDHFGIYCAINRAAMDEGIPTVYVQHACVADYFPRLQSTFSLLDGLDAAEKYLPKGGDSVIFLVGISKYRASQKAHGKKLNAVGVSFNALDDAAQIEAILTHLDEKFGSSEMAIIARLHPKTPAAITKQVENLCTKLGIDTSDSLSENSFEFSERIDVMVCGGSSIILEAAMAGTPSVGFFSDDSPDVYEFGRKGLCSAVCHIHEIPSKVSDLMRTPPDLKNLVRYYSAGYAVDNRPSSSTLCAELITEIAEGRRDFSLWSQTNQQGCFEYSQ